MQCPSWFIRVTFDNNSSQCPTMSQMKRNFLHIIVTLQISFDKTSQRFSRMWLCFDMTADQDMRYESWGRCLNDDNLIIIATQESQEFLKEVYVFYTLQTVPHWILVITTAETKMCFIQSVKSQYAIVP